LTLKNRALSSTDYAVKELEGQLAAAQRKAAMWEELAKMGMPDVILKWMDERVKQ